MNKEEVNKKEEMLQVLATDLVMQKYGAEYTDAKPHMQNAMVLETRMELDEAIYVAISEELQEEDVEQMDKIRSAGGSIEVFINEKIPNLQEVLVLAVQEFAESYLNKDK